MSKPDRVWARRFGSAKGDHEEAAHFVNARPTRTQAKRVLVRARRRYSRAMAAQAVS